MKFKTLSFSKKLYFPLMLSATLSTICELFTEIFDGIVAGLFLNETALTAIAVISPLIMFTTFVSGVIVIGTSNLYLREVGKLNRKHADELFSQALMICIFVSIALFLSFEFFIDNYFVFMGISEAVINEAYEYSMYFKYVILLLPFEYLCELLVYDDGDELICNLASIVYLLTHIFLPIVFVKDLGTRGIGLGNFLSMLSIVVVYLIHFLKKSNNLHFRFYFSFKDIKEIVPLSLIDCIYMLFQSITNLSLNKFVISIYSEKYIPILTVALAVVQMCIVFDGLGVGMTPLCEVYMGEQNYKAEKDLFAFTVIISLIESTLVVLLANIFTPYITQAYGITETENIKLATTCIRIASLCLPFISLAFIYSSQYLILRKVFYGVFIVCLDIFVFPLFFSLICGYLFNFISLWIGFLIGGVASTLITIYLCQKKINKDEYLSSLDKYNIFNKSFIAQKGNIIELRDCIENHLKKNNINHQSIIKIMLLIEEYVANVIDRNNGKNIIGECSVVIQKENIKLYLRDNGQIVDWSDPDNTVTGIEAYIYYNLVDTFEDKRYITTVGYNRTVFNVPLV